MADEQLPRAPRVLVIDDEMAIRAALKRFFTRRGWEYDEAADGRSALDKLLASPVEEGTGYQVVICDLRMPQCSGLELHRELTAARPELTRRLIFSTGDIVSPEVAAFLAGIDRPVLEKPFELSALADAVARVTGTRET